MHFTLNSEQNDPKLSYQSRPKGQMCMISLMPEKPTRGWLSGKFGEGKRVTQCSQLLICFSLSCNPACVLLAARAGNVAFQSLQVVTVIITNLLSEMPPGLQIAFIWHKPLELGVHVKRSTRQKNSFNMLPTMTVTYATCRLKKHWHWFGEVLILMCQVQLLLGTLPKM